jgi:ATP-dependent helicase HrpB
MLFVIIWQSSSCRSGFLGCEFHVCAGHGRVPMKIEVLAPNQRPIQVTDDLSNFWREQYPKIKTELSRRYPRHEWR